MFLCVSLFVSLCALCFFCLLFVCFFVCVCVFQGTLRVGSICINLTVRVGEGKKKKTRQRRGFLTQVCPSSWKSDPAKRWVSFRPMCLFVSLLVCFVFVVVCLFLRLFALCFWLFVCFFVCFVFVCCLFVKNKKQMRFR